MLKENETIFLHSLFFTVTEKKFSRNFWKNLIWGLQKGSEKDFLMLELKKYLRVDF